MTSTPIERVHRASTDADINALLAVAPGSTVRRIVAGATDLLVQARSGRTFGEVVDLSALPTPILLRHHDGIELSATHSLFAIGQALGASFPSLTAAIAVFASTAIRQRATLGGNLAHGSPAADTVPALVAAGASINISSAAGRRSVAAQQFLLGPRRVDLAPGEWIRSITVPVPPPAGGFRKVAGRRAQAISIVSLAWQWCADPDGTLRQARFAMGAVAPTVVRLSSVEAIVEGRQPTPEIVERAARAVSADLSPIDDVRASADYRRRCAAGLISEILSAPTLAKADAAPSATGEQR